MNVTKEGIVCRAWDKVSGAFIHINTYDKLGQLLTMAFNDLFIGQIKNLKNDIIITFHTGHSNWYQHDLIHHRDTNRVFEIVWNDNYFGWWCLADGGAIELPLNEMVEKCDKIGNIFEDGDQAGIESLGEYSKEP